MKIPTTGLFESKYKVVADSIVLAISSSKTACEVNDDVYSSRKEGEVEQR